MQRFRNNMMSFFLTLVIILLITTSVSSYVSLTQVEDETDKILLDTIPISRSADHLLTSLLNQQAGIRGFIATEEEKYLAAFELGKIQLERNLDLVEKHQVNHPVMQTLINEVALPQIEKIQDFFQSQITLVENGHSNLALARLDEGKREMDHYREIHILIEKNITNIINDAWNRTRIASQRSRIITIIGLILTLIIGIAAIHFMKLQKVYRQLENMVTIDALSQLHNRFSFDQTLKKEFQEAQHTHQPISLLLFDIDHFKQYNDNYGHLKGDVCIQQLAAEVRRTFKDTNAFTARYGGEEFAIILPNCILSQAIKVAEQLRENIEALKLVHEFSMTNPYVTISVGVATLTPLYSQRSPLLIEHADKALYKAKETRNQVAVFEG